MFDLLLLVRPSKTTQGFSWKNELLTLPKANEGLIRLTLTSTTLTSLTKPKATISQSDWNRMGHDFKKICTQALVYDDTTARQAN